MLLPSIQFSINQKLKTFSPVSPNMLLFGKQLNDTIDCTNTIEQLNKLYDEKKYKNAFQMIDHLNKSLKVIKSMHDHNYKKYVFIMKKNYDKNKLNRKFQVGDKVMYYVGDRAHTNKKLRARFTGPFKVVKLISDNAVKILNEDTDETMVCHTKMLKLYFDNYFTPESAYARTLKHKQKLDKIIKNKTLSNLKTQRKKQLNACKQSKARKSRTKSQDDTPNSNSGNNSQ